MNRTRGITPRMRALTMQFLMLVQQASIVIDTCPTNPDIQSQANNVPTNGTFSLTNHQTYLPLLEEYQEWTTLNTWWNKQDSKATWETRWKQIWGTDLRRWAKLFIWRILMNNMERAQKVKHRDGCCLQCPGIPETNEHIFFDCYKAKQAWAATTVYYEATPQESLIAKASLVVDLFDSFLQMTLHDTTKIFVIYHT